ncbi:MAG: YceI family protein [Saprospiraceae bacterium]|nr:YceI family protein [Saprospiraceae bacterium]MBK8633123.1 YceI family protein [Saprospiraceae bacterium]HMS70279.1 YceI family protein [Saprospiraceae bacterium]
MKKFFLLAFVAINLNMTAQSVWTMDKSHSKMTFTVTHLAMSEVDGVFKDFDFKITSSKEDFSDAVFEATADLKTLSTNNSMRDGHLQKDDMFDTEKHPTLTFKSTSIKPAGAKKFKLMGDLTMKGITKPVVLDLTLIGTGENQRSKKPMAGFKVTGTVKRTDFGVGTMPGLVVSEDVELVASAEFVKQ